MRPTAGPDLAHPDFDRAGVAAAWSAFVDARPFAGAVRPLVVDSWRRSRAAGVDARGPCGPPIAGTELERRLVANRELLSAGDHTWQLLAESLVASENIFIVTDVDGVILDVRGNDEFVAAAAERNTGRGCDWSEGASGTNAIGTALALERPVIVRSSEHYVEAAKVWDCAASPIRDLVDGAIIGVLDVTSVGNLSDSHTLALAVTAAHQIEHTLHAQALARSVQLLNWYRTLGAQWHQRPAVLVDRKGRLLRIGEQAAPLVESGSAPFAIQDGRPSPTDGQAFTVADVLPYTPPPDFEAAAGDAWHGGVVVLAATGSRDGSRTAAGPDPAFSRIVTADPEMRELMHRAGRMARAASPILLLGETGSGKELFAAAIHDCSPVADGPFVAVNCGTLTHELAASELLGYEAGAFTGAAPRGRAGKFELADGGTLFLDEVGELPPDVQVSLLRVLQDNVVVRVGGHEPRQVRVRVIAATHRDLERDAAAGRFRSDLLFRLRVLALTLPPLRERRGDIPLLVTHYLDRLQETYGLGARRLSADLLDVLDHYGWPGNVRELHGLLESLYILSDRPLLTPADLPQDFGGGAAAAPRARAAAPSLESLERQAIVAAIEDAGRNMTAAARRLGISRSTLYRKLRHYGIER
ncbi:MAG: sigma-54-dependent Fis family transcriptional regulator [Gammaproteobacteria bacterium]